MVNLTNKIDLCTTLEHARLYKHALWKVPNTYSYPNRAQAPDQINANWVYYVMKETNQRLINLLNAFEKNPDALTLLAELIASFDTDEIDSPVKMLDALHMKLVEASINEQLKPLLELRASYNSTSAACFLATMSCLTIGIIGGMGVATMILTAMIPATPLIITLAILIPTLLLISASIFNYFDFQFKNKAQPLYGIEQRNPMHNDYGSDNRKYTVSKMQLSQRFFGMESNLNDFGMHTQTAECFNRLLEGQEQPLSWLNA